MDIFFEIGLLVIFAGLGTYIAKLTKQPLIPAYIISGVVIGNVLGLVTNHELIANLSEIGIAFLLFMVGLELEFRKLKDMGVVSSIAGTVQMATVFFLGYVVTKLLGFTKVEAVYLGLVIAFSSTMIVIKILSDNLETNTLHGRMTIGILVVQDIFAVIALSYLASVSSGAMGYLFFAKVLLVIAFGVLASKLVFPAVFEFAARSRELLLTISLGVCFLFALLFSAVGLSITIGAFFAGVLLANLPYNIEIVGKVKPLRDFFAIMFFTSLGLQLSLEGASSILIPLAVLLLLVVVGKTLILHVTLMMLKHQARTSFITATSLAQISEFSLIIVLQGANAGVLPQSVLTLTIFLAIITMTFTSYFMSYENSFYHQAVSLMRRAGLNVAHHHKQHEKKMSYDVILCGYDRIGYSVLNSLNEQKKSVVVVDFNPDVIKKLKNMGVPCIYGDICDPEIMGHLDMKQSHLVISTANMYEDNLLLLQKVKAANKYIPTIVTAHKIDEALELYKEGADYVILPHFLGGDMVASMLSDFESNQLRTLMVKYKHINDLIQRKNVGQDHPTHLASS
ncbi:cation:proton antiporter [Candidatus Woesearchaeota archaeon]|nr:cation:proton antiporter [Candidatus Woesearchaeota archaeon]